MNYYYPDFFYDDYHNGQYYYYYYNYDIMIFIFLIAGICVGLPALVWALWALYNYRKTSERIPVFIPLLLLNDLAELLLNGFIVSYLFFDNSAAFTLDINQISWSEHVYSYHNIVYNRVGDLWFALKIYGLYLHQLVALQHILSLKKQTCSSNVFTPPCSIILCTILSLTVFGSQFVELLLFNVILCLLPFCILVITCILSCKVPDHVPHSGMRSGSAVLIVSTLTLFASCSPFIVVFIYLKETNRNWIIYDTVSSFLVSMRVVSDPVLCVLVCKENLRAQTHQTHTEVNTDHQSV